MKHYAVGVPSVVEAKRGSQGGSGPTPVVIALRAGFYSGSDKVQVRTRVVIAADGVESQVGRWASLNVQLPLEDTLVCAQYLLAGVKVDPTCTCYTISHEIAPGGYARIFPKGEDKANADISSDTNRSNSGSGMVQVLPCWDR